MSGAALPLIVLVGSLGLILMGLLFRSGRLRAPANMYLNERLPVFLRNAPLVSIPLGLCTAAFAIVALGPVAGLPRWVGFGVSLLGFLFGAIAGWLLPNPPSFVKPTWLRDLEVEHPPAQPTRDAIYWIDRGAIVIFVLLAATTAGALVWAALVGDIRLE